MTEYNYETIKELAKSSGVRTEDLIALHRKNDPFYAGTDADWQMGNWFANLWKSFGYGTGVHLRRVHYQVISQSPRVKLPITMVVSHKDDRDKTAVLGDEYINTDECWSYLSQAGKMARYLGLVDPEAFDDRRNPAAVIKAQTTQPNPQIMIYDNLWNVPKLPEFAEPPYYYVDDFRAQQRYMVELWCEKSTMNDVLLPICDRYGANLQTGLGELSITATLSLVQRVIDADMPTVVFYISDYDPAGRSMPVAAGRKIEYFVRTLAPSAEIKLIPIVLTAEQVRQYRLPRTPIKATETRGAKFEAQHGEGAVELDALEALHPGELDRIVSSAIEDFYDDDLEDEVREVRQTLHSALNRVRQRVLDRHENAIDKLRARYDAIKLGVEQQLAELAADQKTLYEQITRELQSSAPRISDYPIPEAREADYYGDALYDSELDYVEQLNMYREFQGKDRVAVDV